MDEARELVNDLEDAGFGQEAISAKGYVTGLTEIGVPEAQARYFAEGASQGGAVVCVSAEDQVEADQAAAIMASHGAKNQRICPDPRPNS